MRAPLFRTQDLPPSSLCLTFDNLLTKSAFVPLVKKVLSTVQAAYGRPVDIEFAWDDNKLYILQCRSLSMRREVERVVLPAGVADEDTLFVTQSGLSNAVITDIEYVVYVDPRAYDRLDTVEKKHKVGWAVGQLNKRLAGHRYALMGPGRWGSNDINLGVRVSYADINNTRLLVEIAFARDGYTPEVSYGTHFFADLVEADIAIMPLYPDTTGQPPERGVPAWGRATSIGGHRPGPRRPGRRHPRHPRAGGPRRACSCTCSSTPRHRRGSGCSRRRPARDGNRKRPARRRAFSIPEAVSISCPAWRSCRPSCSAPWPRGPPPRRTSGP